ncbi:DUF4349 domain-containing protein [Aurantiacibacter sp. MUD61]|uniref:DUF4349 domain-containing protein n=1 Tax=Aurantiacibacter sp. MUD61 TaxID=3009083 RepID=UPI0022F01BA1|nr:DUF4349 domain-containing protein [Aurantiacibacter sp. MUD61]
MGESYEDASATESVFADSEASAEVAAEDSVDSAIQARPDIPVNLPRMAYVYDYGFRLEAEGIADLQDRHADMCEAAGPYTCQIVSQSQSGYTDDDYATGRLELAVVADQARAFGARLGGAAETAGGEQVSSAITGEDLTRNMVDTEARLRSRILLRDRMMEVLRTRNGSVEELVEAERSVAQINEEIDRARSWLEEMRQRVAYTRINITYSSATAPSSDFLSPVASAVGAIGTILGYMLALAILLATVAIPIGGVVYAARLAKRRLQSEAIEA